MATTTDMPTAAANFKAGDAASYDGVADVFDRFTERLVTPLASRMFCLARVQPADRVLDVGTGTGIVALRAARELRGGSVLGVDLSDGMLAVAGKRARLEELGEVVDFRQMDAEALDLPDQSFDVVLSLFALRHFPDPLRALKEMFRVLKPGGRLALGIGSGPPMFSRHTASRAAGRIWEAMNTFRGKLLVAPGFLDGLMAKHLPELLSQHAAMPAGPHHRCDATRLVKAAGFRGITSSWEGRLSPLQTADEFWELQTTYSGAARKGLPVARPETVEALRRDFFTQCDRVLARGGSLVYRHAALFVVAERPQR